MGVLVEAISVVIRRDAIESQDLEGDTQHTPRGGLFRNYSRPVWRYARERVLWAESDKVNTVEACNSWYSGAYLMETILSALLILTRYAHDPEEAIVRAVNDTRDNDTIAAIVGAAVRALHGRDALPIRWIEGLSGRTGENDDGKAVQLLKIAAMNFQ